MRPEKPQRGKNVTPSHAAVPKIDDPASDRATRLAQLKLAIDTGTYRISSDRIADKMLRRLRNAPTKN